MKFKKWAKPTYIWKYQRTPEKMWGLLSCLLKKPILDSWLSDYPALAGQGFKIKQGHSYVLEYLAFVGYNIEPRHVISNNVAFWQV